MVADSNEYDVYKPSLSTVVRAVLERKFFVKSDDGTFHPPPQPGPGQIDELLEKFAKLMDLAAHYATPLSPSAFAEAYPGRRRAVYLKAAADNLKYGFNDLLAHIKFFFKVEKLNFTVKLDPVPRGISPRDPGYLVETGRYFKPIEKKMYKCINVIFNDITVYKGLNMEARGRAMYSTWGKYAKPVAIGLDAKRFDQHVSLQALKWEHARYKKYYPGDKHFARLMKLQERNIFKARVPGEGHLSFKQVGGRQSGDSNTALGNVLLMCAMVYCYLKEHNLFDYCSLANDGDDCVLIGESWIVEIVMATIDGYFLKLGFSLTVEKPIYVFEKIEFCQSHPVFDGTQYLMVRDPRVAIAKDSVSLKPLDSKGVYEKWCAAVGKGGLSLTAGLPVWQSFYRRFVRLSRGATPLSDPTLEGGFWRLSRGMERVESAPTDAARYSFWLAFDISPAEQECLENYYDNLDISFVESINRFAVIPLHGKVW